MSVEIGKRIMKSVAAAGLVVGALGMAPFAAQATPYTTLQSIAGTYSVYTVGNMGGAAGGQAYSSDSEGKMAIGGNAYLQSFGAYSNIVVGGDLKLTNGSVTGSAKVGGTATLSSAAVNGGLTQHDPSLGIDFAATSAILTQASDLLAALGANGTKVSQYGGLTLTATDSTFNVINLTTADLTNINALKINAPATSTLVINVTGASLTTGNFGFQLTGIDNKHIIFNFVDATSLQFSGVAWQGTILATDASIRGVNGNYNGAVIAHDLIGVTYQNMEFHNVPYVGTLPTPAVSGLPLFGLAGLAVVGRRRRGTALQAAA
jgi:choice-of-anchor A domain-containing protein